MHFQKRAAADGRTERKEAGTQGKGTEIQVPFGLRHPQKGIVFDMDELGIKDRALLGYAVKYDTVQHGYEIRPQTLRF